MNAASRRILIVTLAACCLLGALAARAGDSGRPQGWLGVLLGDPPKVASAEDAAAEPAHPQGVLVRGVVADSPADKARLRAKDLIVAVNGSAVRSRQELSALLRGLEPGTSLTLSVRRQDRDLELSARVGTREEDGGRMRMVAGWIGIEAIGLPPSLRDHFGAPEDAGIMISAVAPDSPALGAGIRVGDVIYEADGRPVTSVAALSQIVTEAGVDNPVEVVLARDGARIVVEPLVSRLPDPQPANPSR